MAKNMAGDVTSLEVDHDTAARRFSTVVDGERAVLDYSLTGSTMTITHTGVPTPIQGRGVAAELMRGALEAASARGWQIVPACSYAAAYMARNSPDARRPHDATRPHDALQPGDAGGAAEAGRRHQSDLLDEALEESFPASDSPAVGGSD